MKIRAAVAGAAIGVVGLTSAVPASAATSDADACRIMGPEYVEDAIECVCTILSLLDDGPWVCDPA